MIPFPQDNNRTLMELTVFGDTEDGIGVSIAEALKVQSDLVAWYRLTCSLASQQNRELRDKFAATQSPSDVSLLFRESLELFPKLACKKHGS